MIEGLLKDSARSSRKRLAQNSHFSTQAMLALLILRDPNGNMVARNMPNSSVVLSRKTLQSKLCAKRTTGIGNLVKSLMCCKKCDPPFSTTWCNEEWSQRYNWKSWSNSDSLWNERKIHRKGATTVIWSCILYLYDANQSVWGNIIAPCNFLSEGGLCWSLSCLKEMDSDWKIC